MLKQPTYLLGAKYPLAEFAYSACYTSLWELCKNLLGLCLGWLTVHLRPRTIDVGWGWGRN